MRRFALLYCLFSMYVSFGQTEEAFLHSKGYLIQGMSTLELPANRTGWWRLSPPVAVRYSLEISEAFDQRMDPVWSTKAAQRWWNDLFLNFDDSVLADDAFVNGPAHATRISYDAIAYLKWQRVFEEWKTRSMDSLPDLPGPPLKVTGSLYWPDIREVMNWSESQYRAFEKFNPSLKDDHLKDGEDAYLRFEEAPSVEQMLAWHDMGRSRDSSARVSLWAARERISKNIPDPSTHERLVHKVRSGEFLGTIANRYHVGLSELKKWNNLQSDLIRVGQELVIYAERDRIPVRETAVETSSEGQVRSDEEDREEVRYKVKTGDTLWSIARDYPGVSADDIMRWNDIDEDIREGQEILILIPSKPAAP